jgi:methylmalonyl-CoA/ethylmalonyl-CoA epimerase
MPKVKKINHIGLAVEDIESALLFWEGALGIKLDHTEETGDKSLKLGFLKVGDSELEMVQPTTPDSTMTKFLEKRGPGIHHICLEVDDIDGMLAQLKEKGIQLIDETPREMEGRRLAFVHPKSTGGVLLELYELV